MPDINKHSMQVLNLALQIADDTCRAGVEEYALAEAGADPYSPLRYDLTQPNNMPGDTEEEMQRLVARAQLSARYIRLRGDALPFVMHTDPVYDGIVWFDEKPQS